MSRKRKLVASTPSSKKRKVYCVATSIDEKKTELQKKCNGKCGETKPTSEFYYNKKKNKYDSTCRSCKTKATACVHGKRKYQCKDCGGRGICQHGKQKYFCKECGGRGICEHGKHKYQCKDCGGSSICEHGRQKYFCKDCG
eukprot:17910_1